MLEILWIAFLWGAGITAGAGVVIGIFGALIEGIEYLAMRRSLRRFDRGRGERENG